METAQNWIRMLLVAACAVSAVGALYELRTAWRWLIAPAIGIAEAPQRVSSHIAFVLPKANAQPAFRQEIGETRYRGSTGYIASATFDDDKGVFRIVHSEGLFATPSKGREVEVAYLPALLDSEPAPAPGNAVPAEAEGALLTFDILYGRACLYVGLAAVSGVVLLGLRHFGVL